MTVVRAIEPVQATADDLARAWTARRHALREGNVAAAGEARARLLAVKEELGIENLRAFASSEIRDSRRALAARLEVDAVAHAELAARLAPGLPEGHLQLARARLARDPSRPGPALEALGGALAAAARDPYTVRAFGADALVALLAALVAAGAAAVGILLLRRLPLILHDFHDLPLVRAGTAVQAALLALALLALPLALGLGPLAALCGAVVAAWLYLTAAERLVATAAVLALVATPFAVERGARVASFGGTLAEEVWEVQHDLGDAAAARVARRATLPAAALAALGGEAKRRGDLEAARALYGRALEAGGREADLLVNLGNVHLLRGEAEAAKSAWLDAVDRAGADLEALAAAQYNLSKLYVRQASLDQAQEARRRAAQAAPALVARLASADGDFRANRYLLDVPLSPARIRALAADDPAPAALGAAARSKVAGALPAHLFPWAPLGLLALLWAGVPFARRLRPSRACDKCGRPACSRCDQAGGLLCGQCVNVYVKRGVVEARDRVRKDRQVRRRARLARLAARAAALAGGGPGHLLRGEPLRGYLVLAALFFALALAVLHRGVLPPPQPTPFAALGRLAVAVPLGAIVWLTALRAVFKRTRG
jgi:tetratricopeptide (TPR) repeat protein